MIEKLYHKSICYTTGVDQETLRLGHTQLGSARIGRLRPLQECLLLISNSELYELWLDVLFIGHKSTFNFSDTTLLFFEQRTVSKDTSADALQH